MRQLTNSTSIRTKDLRASSDQNVITLVPVLMLLRSRKLIPILLAAFLVSPVGVSRAQTKTSVAIPGVQSIANGVVTRTSDNNDPSRGHLPPWKQVEITNVGFERSPKIGDKVTIVPLDVAVAPFELTILKTQGHTKCEEPRGEIWWEVILEPVTDKQVFEIPPLPSRREEYPFDVAVIYPAVDFAAQLRRSELKKSRLPRGVHMDTVTAAIDLTRDGVPEILIVEYCCLQPNRAIGECDYTCGKTFLRAKNQWKLIDTSGPC